MSFYNNFISNYRYFTNSENLFFLPNYFAGCSNNRFACRFID